MIQYEVYLPGTEGPFKTFASAYQFSINETLYFEKSGVPLRLLVTKITHNLVGETHVVRLNCQYKKAFD